MAENITITCKEVIEKEKNALRERREKLGIDHRDAEGENWFGIALSGGGIRSATINLGFLKTLHKFGILEKADYLSTVSGGGYCGAFVQATSRAEGTMANIFSDDKIDALRNHGEYMIPGRGWPKRWNQFLLVVAYFVSTIMSFVSPGIVFGVGFFLYQAINGLLPEFGFGSLNMSEDWSNAIKYSVWGVLFAHLLFNVFRNFDLEISKKFNQIETAIASLGVILLVVWGFSKIRIGGGHLSGQTTLNYFLAAAILIILGLLINPNAISFHRFYRHQLANCYLQFAGKWKNTLLKDLFSTKTTDKTGFIAPYPLINTCLNLQNPTGDEKFKGAKASDYFLLSPLFVGSKLTGYVETARYADYEDMTLPAASAISAAAVNPGMGIYSNKILSILMTVFNARLGFWISNPLTANKLRSIIWWPSYFFKELTSTIGTKNKKVNISDGGHIENLAVYELLRRRCSLIIAFDAGEDASYQFLDLENLVVRARNELGIEIKFRPEQQPEHLIRPTPSHGYSRQRFAVADLMLLWEDTKIYDAAGKGFTQSKTIPGGRKIGTFVYVKSSVTAPTSKPTLTEEKDKLKFDTYKYKIYHPAFPHESTGDQFFDPVQWESYFQLGQHIGADVLGLRHAPDDYAYETAFKINFAGLKAHFDENLPLFEENMAQFAPTVGLIREENENESFQMGGVTASEPPAAAAPKSESRSVLPPPIMPKEAETGYRM